MDRVRACKSLGLVSFIALASMFVAAQKKTTLYNFTNGNDGGQPFAGVSLSATGALYGTASNGGDEGCSAGAGYCGTVFELAPFGNGIWVESTIYTFGQNLEDGSTPDSELVFDSEGKLYGATSFPQTMYQLVPGVGGSWSSNPLFAGDTPFSPLVDKQNNLYNSDVIGDENGTIIQLSPNPDGTFTQTVLYSFAGGVDGVNPAGLVMDSGGRIWGTTTSGGDMSCNPPSGCGTIFVLLPPKQQGGSWTHHVLYSFAGGSLGNSAYYPIARDNKGNLYGIASTAGSPSCSPIVCALVFELSPPGMQGGAWSYSVIHTFTGGNDGAYPQGGLVVDSRGGLYGTTTWGGGGPCVHDGTLVGCGTIYRFTPPSKSGDAWQETFLHQFQSGSDGAYPMGRVLLDEKHKVLYGTTGFGGGYFAGTVFQITP